jgi:hypothetical protein
MFMVRRLVEESWIIRDDGKCKELAKHGKLFSVSDREEPG